MFGVDPPDMLERGSYPIYLRRSVRWAGWNKNENLAIRFAAGKRIDANIGTVGLALKMWQAHAAPFAIVCPPMIEADQQAIFHIAL